MIRLAKTEDLNNITDVYSYARKFMAENGNPTQWGTNYPSEQLIENDINNKKMYVKRKIKFMRYLCLTSVRMRHTR